MSEHFRQRGTDMVPAVISLVAGLGVMAALRAVVALGGGAEAATAGSEAGEVSAVIRYLTNDFCLGIAALGLAGLIYAGLQLWGLALDRRSFAGTAAATPPAVVAYVTGRHPDLSEVLTRHLSGGMDVLLLSTDLSDMWETLRSRRATFLTFTVWALPLLGFIGTVVGISGAIGSLGEVFVASAREAALAEVLASLRFAFDTTFVGLAAVLPTMLAAQMVRVRSDEARRVLLSRVLAESR